MDTTGWTAAVGGSVLTRNTSPPASGVGLPSGVTESFNLVTTANGGRASVSIAVTNGVTYRYSLYVRLNSLSATELRIALFNASPALKAHTAFSTVGGNFQRIDVSFTADATETWTFRVLQQGTGAMNVDFSAVLIEESASLGSYFDGSHTNAGWLGTAHASQSDLGVLGNGKTVTFGGIAKRVNQSAVHTLLGGDVATNPTQVKLASGSGNLLVLIGGTTYTFTSAWPNDALPHIWELVFREAADTLDLRIDGTLIEAKTGVTAQHVARQTLKLGAYATSSDPFSDQLGSEWARTGEWTAPERRALALGAMV